MAANPILGGGGFHHVCVKTRDWDRTLAFYRDALGCVEKIAWRERPQRAVMLDTGDGNYIEIFEDPAYVPAANGAILHFALRTTRLDEVATRVRAAGAKITMEPKDVAIATTNGAGTVPIRIFFCEGPSGEVIEFFQNSAT
ncbi:MAG TPA: VOC family protein [Opitutaceae bacterium]|nr:VOC family protein [Opitutaceae bacterium]